VTGAVLLVQFDADSLGHLGATIGADMRIVYFANGPVALDILRFLREAGEEIVGLVLHEPEAQRLGDEIRAASGLDDDAVFTAGQLGAQTTIDAIATLGADIGYSALFAHILKPAMLGLFPDGVLNVHPGYLPYNRGRNAQIWGIVEHTPVGATLHTMDESVDTGAIVHRVPVAIDATDTGASLRSKLERACVDVAKAGWPAVLAGAPTIPQSLSEGTAHKVRDLEAIARIDLDATYRAGDLIDLLRALTSPPQANGAYVEIDGRKIRLSLTLEEEEI